MTPDEAIKIIESRRRQLAQIPRLIDCRIKYEEQGKFLDEVLVKEIERLRRENEQLKKRPVDFNNMTLNQIHDFVKELDYRARQFREIQATLIINCKPGRRLDDFEIEYNESKSVLFNLIHILETLISKIEERST